MKNKFVPLPNHQPPQKKKKKKAEPKEKSNEKTGQFNTNYSLYDRTENKWLAPTKCRIVNIAV